MKNVDICSETEFIVYSANSPLISPLWTALHKEKRVGSGVSKPKLVNMCMETKFMFS